MIRRLLDLLLRRRHRPRYVIQRGCVARKFETYTPPPTFTSTTAEVQQEIIMSKDRYGADETPPAC